MGTQETLGLIVTLLVMALGCAGCLLPGLPGTPLVLLSALGHKICFRDQGAGWIVLTTLVLITALALVMDYLATVFGARRFGATRKGMIGAVVGGLAGLWFNLLGILLGPFIGATCFELAGGRPLREAARAGLGATLGLFAGAVGKIICCLAMMILFTINVLWRTLG